MPARQPPPGIPEGGTGGFLPGRQREPGSSRSGSQVVCAFSFLESRAPLGVNTFFHYPTCVVSPPKTPFFPQLPSYLFSTFLLKPSPLPLYVVSIRRPTDQGDPSRKDRDRVLSFLASFVFTSAFHIISSIHLLFRDQFVTPDRLRHPTSRLPTGS